MQRSPAGARKPDAHPSPAKGERQVRGPASAQTSILKIEMAKVSSRKYISLTTVVAWLCLFGASNCRSGWVVATSDNNCVACHATQKDKSGLVVSIYQTSTHGKTGVGCDGCHGGDSSQIEKAKAHAGQFVSHPDSNATLEMCGKCHRQPVEFFKASRHVASRPNAARLDCVECHGVHAIGAESESFRWPRFCAGCHGLEYLPRLPQPFQEMLSLADDLREGLRRLEARRLARPEFAARRKEIRHSISELVHQTDSRGAERISRILELGESLKQQIASADR